MNKESFARLFFDEREYLGTPMSYMNGGLFNYDTYQINLKIC